MGTRLAACMIAEAEPAARLVSPSLLQSVLGLNQLSAGT